MPVLPLVVLDTNVVLDWLYFQDRRCARLIEALTNRRLRWIASPAMRSEIDHVLHRGLRGAWPRSTATVSEGWDRWATMVADAPPVSSTSMRCTDADDQKFIELALHVRATALLSADRAVLRLARPAKAHGLQIMTVDAWSKAQPQSN